MILFIDRTQFVLIPTIGFVADEGYWNLTIAFMCFGISFRICPLNELDDL